MTRKVAVMVPSPKDVTALVVASSELSKTYMEIQSHYDMLLRQTRTVVTRDEDGTEITSIIDHPDLKYWAKLRIDCLAKIASLSQTQQQNDIENKFRAINTIMQHKDELPPEVMENFIRYQMEEERKRAN